MCPSDPLLSSKSSADVLSRRESRASRHARPSLCQARAARHRGHLCEARGGEDRPTVARTGRSERGDVSSSRDKPKPVMDGWIARSAEMMVFTPFFTHVFLMFLFK